MKRTRAANRAVRLLLTLPAWTGGSAALADTARQGPGLATVSGMIAPRETAAGVAGLFASEVVAAQPPFGPSPYDDPAAVLGAPATDFHDPLGVLSGGTTQRRVKLVESAYDLDVTRTHKLITTLGEGSSLVVRFGAPVTDDPAHPYGIDFLVFGNASYAASDFVDDRSNLNTLLVMGAVLSEPLKVSVSPGFSGAPGEDPTNAATWPWYRYDKGPWADGAFPTQAYRWDRANATWSDDLMDFTRPVNPAFATVLEAGSGLTVADAIDLYDGSGGGTGFDLAESGFAAIRYVRIEGATGFSDGEIDALAVVRPAVLGDSLTIAAGNLASGQSTLRFQQPSEPSRPAISLSFTSVSEAVRVVTSPLTNTPVSLANLGRVLTTSRLDAAPVPGTNPGSFGADLRVWAGREYQGNGDDLVLLREGAGAVWEPVPAVFDLATRSVAVAGVTNLFTVALVEIEPPRIRVTREPDGSGTLVRAVRFAAVPGFQYVLERSDTAAFLHPEDVAGSTARSAGEVTLFDGERPGNTFYRVRVRRS